MTCVRWYKNAWSIIGIVSIASMVSVDATEVYRCATSPVRVAACPAPAYAFHTNLAALEDELVSHTLSHEKYASYAREVTPYVTYAQAALINSRSLYTILMTLIQHWRETMHKACASQTALPDVWYDYLSRTHPMSISSQVSELRSTDPFITTIATTAPISRISSDRGQLYAKHGTHWIVPCSSRYTLSCHTQPHVIHTHTRYPACVLVLCVDGILYYWDERAQSVCTLNTAQQVKPYACALDAQGLHIATAMNDGSVWTWERTYTLMHTHTYYVCQADETHETEELTVLLYHQPYLICAGARGTFQIIDTQTHDICVSGSVPGIIYESMYVPEHRMYVHAYYDTHHASFGTRMIQIGYHADTHAYPVVTMPGTQIRYDHEQQCVIWYALPDGLHEYRWYPTRFMQKQWQPVHIPPQA